MQKIYIFMLATSLTACGGGSSNSGGSSSTNDTPIAGTALDCDGTRIWGPAPQDSDTPDELDYLSEGFGNTGPECVVSWSYNTSGTDFSNGEPCSQAELASDDVDIVARVQSDGSLVVRLNGDQQTLQPADVSLQDLQNIPDCEPD